MKSLKYLIKKSLLDIGNIIASIFNKDVEKSNIPNTLSIVAIIKNEATYIDEWIKYHIAVGVENFYLYDNDSSDDTVSILKDYIEEGIVTLISFPGRGKQLPAYNDAIKKFKTKTRYMAFIDADEFLYSCDTKKSVKQQVEEIFTLSPNVGGIAINWRMFGSSGHVSRPVGGVLENYLYRAKDNGKGNDCIKTIVNPRRVYKYTHPHYPTYYIGYYSIDENGEKVNGWSHPMTEIKRLRINPYFTKSKEEWIVRRSLGEADHKNGSDDRTIEEFYAHDNNDIYDDGMLEFVERMKAEGEPQQ